MRPFVPVGLAAARPLGAHHTTAPAGGCAVLRPMSARKPRRLAENDGMKVQEQDDSGVRGQQIDDPGEEYVEQRGRVKAGQRRVGHRLDAA